MPTQPLDPKVKAMTQAIRDTESGGDFNAKGASGEFGAYQFMPDTWQAYAREAGVNAPFGSATPDQQNEVAYKKIKQWKDQGYNVGQIASMWNAGPGKPNAYVEGNKGTNTQGVAYDTQAYAEKVAKAYQRLKGQTGQPDVPMTPEQVQDPNLLTQMGNTLAEVGSKTATAIGDTASGKINPVSGLIRGGGAIIGGAGDLVTDVLEHTPVVGGVLKGAEGLIGRFAEGIAETDAGQSAMQGYQRFAEAHPELAGNIGAGVDIATALPVLKGVKIVKGKLGSLVDTALHGKTDDVLETVSGHMTPKKMSEAIATRGTETKGLLRDVRIKPDPYDVKVSDAVKALVPKFNAGKPLLNNVNAVQTVVNETNKQLKQRVQELGKDRIYSFRELGSALNRLDVPDIIAEDTYLQNLHNRLVGHALRIAKSKGGKVPTLLDARQEFDSFVKRQYPNVFNSMDRTSPLSATVKSIRNAMTEFTVKNLPEDALLKETLQNEHLLITAIENMAEKASKGSTREVGTDMFERYGKRHPVQKGLVKGGATAVAQGLGLGGVMKIMD